MKSLNLTAILTGIFALILSGCATHKLNYNDGYKKTLEIMKNDKARFAILLNDNEEVTIIGIDKGQRFISCRDQEKAGKPCLKLDPKGTKYGKTFKVEVIEGSLCVNIYEDSKWTQKCSRPDGDYPEAYIRALMAQ